jgi:hypothetical protein
VGVRCDGPSSDRLSRYHPRPRRGRARVCSRGAIIKKFSSGIALSEGSINVFAILDDMIRRAVMVTPIWGDGSRDLRRAEWCRRWVDSGEGWF